MPAAARAHTSRAPWNVAWNVACDVAWNVACDVAWNVAWNVACDVAWNVACNVALLLLLLLKTCAPRWWTPNAYVSAYTMIDECVIDCLTILWSRVCHCLSDQ